MECCCVKKRWLMVLAIRKYFLPPRVNDRFCAIPEGNLNASKMQTTFASSYF